MSRLPKRATDKPGDSRGPSQPEATSFFRAATTAPLAHAVGFRHPACREPTIDAARYARPRNPPESERGLILRSIRAVFWEHFERAA